MKKYLAIIATSLVFSSMAYANDINKGVQAVTKQRDIADYNCKNNLPNPQAAIGFCKKRDGLQRKLDNMNNVSNYKNNSRNNHHNNNHNHNNHHHNNHSRNYNH